MIGRLRPFKFNLALAGTLFFGLSSLHAAHTPVFMRHYGIPGKNALDLFTVYHTETANSKAQQLTQGVLFGLSARNSFEIEAPFFMKDKFRSDSVSLGLISNVFRFDGFGHKKFVVLNVQDKLRGENDILHHTLTGGGSFVVEYLDWLLFTSLSDEAGVSGGHAHGEASSGTGGGTYGRSPWLAVAYGRRFVHIPETHTDAVAFLELYRKLDNPLVQYLAAEVMFQPNRRMLFKLGHRFPVVEEEGIDVKSHWALHMELRL